MEVEPPLKKSKLLQPNTGECIFCCCKLHEKTSWVKDVTKEGLQTIFNACEIRKDNVCDRLLPFKADLLSGAMEIAYHKACRAAYTSASNLKHVERTGTSCTVQELITPPPTPESHTKARQTRDETSSFNIRQNCFICGKTRRGSGRGEKLTQVVTGTGKNTREKVLSAASERHDETVWHRMVTYADLFAYDAKYHRSCYAAYISKKNIEAAQRRYQESRRLSSCDLAFQELVDEIQLTLLSGSKSVTSLAEIKCKYVEKLTRHGLSTEVYSWKLKIKLKQYFKNEMVFLEQPGQSDIVCSSSMTVGDALWKAAALQNIVNMTMEPESDGIDCQRSVDIKVDEQHILHSAAGILRREMSHVQDSSQFYESSTKISMKHCADYVPPKLYDFISWLLDEKKYNNVTDSLDGKMKANNLGVIALSHNIIAQSQRVRTPITLGLGLYVHHEFGSRRLVEQLNLLGHSISYDEVRRFLTSAAVDVQGQEVYVPKGLQEQPNCTIDAAIDNFDQNEATLDGKSTTHAMASVIYQRSTDEVPLHSEIPRVRQKSLQNQPGHDLHRYEKPKQRPEPPTTTDSSFTDVNASSPSYENAEKRDLLWMIGRLSQPEETQSYPAWSGFNSFLTTENIPVTKVHYMPFIQAPPSDFSTIYESLIRLVQVANALGQDHILVTADMQIYAKAQEIIWAKPPALAGKVTMRLGGMHLNMALLASLGTLYGDGGLLQLLTDSEVYAEATARQMLQGKQYARGIRGIKLILEALLRILFTSVESWMQNKGEKLISPEFEEKLQALKEAFEANDVNSAIHLSEEIEKNHFHMIQKVISDYRQAGREMSETFVFWDSFLEGAYTLLHLLRAEREANFELHLNAVCESIPWFQAAGRNTYAKFVPTYLADMKALEETHPESYEQLSQGSFVVRRSVNNNFNAVATDQALEQTVNKEGKSKGGVIGLTLKEGALTRWLQTRHVSAEYAEAFESLCQSKKETTKHHEQEKARLAKDEEDVCKIVQAASRFLNPFNIETVPVELVNIATGQVASPEVRKSLTNFRDVGKKKHHDFVTKRLVQQSKSKSFWAVESRAKTVTFASMRKSTTTKTSLPQTLDSEVLFRRLLGVSQQREVSLERVLEHELAAVPPSLFNDDGTIRKGTKSDLAKKLEATTEEVYSLPSAISTGYIIDGMALLQALNEKCFSTFDDLGRQVMHKIKEILQSDLCVEAIAIVFDRYDDANSVKQSERNRRGDDFQTTHVIKGSQKVPSYRKFMKSSGNKAALAAFVCDFIESESPEALANGQNVILAGGFPQRETVKVVTKDTSSLCTSLYSTQEEADTRMILHAVDFASRLDRIIIHSDDTDVLVLLLHYTDKHMLGSCVYMHAGHTTRYINRERYIPIVNISREIGHAMCESLPAVHALTGCDTTSSFAKVGKRTVYNKLVDYSKQNPSALATFGQTNDADRDVETATQFILHVYGNKEVDYTSLDQLRYLMATTTDVPAAHLPPTQDAFKQHTLRARYQTSIWCQAHVPCPTIGHPVGNGWKNDGCCLTPVMFLNEAAPTEVRDVTHLYCVDHNCKETRNCHCRQAGLQCTEFCSCQGDECCNAASSTTTDYNSE